MEIHKENCTSKYIDKLQRSLDEIKSLFRRCWRHGDYKDPEYKGNQKEEIRHHIWKMLCSISKSGQDRRMCFGGQYQSFDTAFEQMVETKNIFYKTGARQG